jgi:hypothetical protein
MAVHTSLDEAALEAAAPTAASSPRIDVWPREEWMVAAPMGHESRFERGVEALSGPRETTECNAAQLGTPPMLMTQPPSPSLRPPSYLARSGTLASSAAKLLPPPALHPPRPAESVQNATLPPESPAPPSAQIAQLSEMRELTPRALRARMLERDAPHPQAGYAALVDYSLSLQKQRAALADQRDASAGERSFVGVAQAAAHRRATALAESSRHGAQLARKARGGPEPFVSPPTLLEPRAAKANMRRIEREEQKLFEREQRRLAEESEAARTGIPPIKQRLASLVDDLNEPRPPPRDFDAEINALLDRYRT